MRTSPTPRGPIPGTLEDPDEGSGVHPVGYDHRGKKNVKQLPENSIILMPRRKDDYEIDL